MYTMYLGVFQFPKTLIRHIRSSLCTIEELPFQVTIVLCRSKIGQSAILFTSQLPFIHRCYNGQLYVCLSD